MYISLVVREGDNGCFLNYGVTKVKGGTSGLAPQFERVLYFEQVIMAFGGSSYRTKSE